MATSKDMIDIETEVAADIKGGPREKLAYATENIVPLLCEIEGDAVRDATADIVCDQVKGLKKSWMNKAIQSELDRRFAEHLRIVMHQEKVELERRSQEYQEKVADA